MSIIKRITKALANKALSGAPPEFFLVAACCWWPSSEARSQAVRTAALASTDWPRVLRIIQRHRVFGLAQDGIARAGVSLSPEVDRDLRAEAFALARRNLAMAAETARLEGWFEEAGVPIIFFKGMSLALLAYGNVSLKDSIDIDILVAPEQFEAAKGVLEKVGYALIEPLPALTPSQFELLKRHRKDWALLARDRNMLVELHWKLNSNPFLLANVGPEFRVQSVGMGRSKIQTLCFDDLFVYLCVHGARHGWHQLKWLADFAALFSTRGDQDLESLYRTAQRAGAGMCAGQAMLLCERLLGVKLPVSLTRELRQSVRLELLEALALNAMLGGGAETELRTRSFGKYFVLLSGFLVNQSWRGALYEFRDHFISGQDLFALKLPRWLNWLYPILRLPMWIWRRLGWV